MGHARVVRAGKVKNTVGRLDETWSVGGHRDHMSGGELTKQLHEEIEPICIEVRVGLIQEQKRRATR
jgi:hypothetical protein